MKNSFYNLYKIFFIFLIITLKLTKKLKFIQTNTMFSKQIFKQSYL